MAARNGRKTKQSGKAESKRAGSQRAGSRKAEAEREPLDSNLKNEIIFISLLAIVIFLFLCNFQIMGAVGEFVSKIMFGIFGLPAYITPFFFFLAIYFGVSNFRSAIAARKIIAGLILYFVFGIICEAVSYRITGEAGFDIKEIYHRSAEASNGGGVVFGSLTYLSQQYLGAVGTVLLLIVLAIISFVILFNRSFISGVRNSGEKIYKLSQIEIETRHSENQIWREEKKRRAREEKENESILRRDKKVSGVMQNTKLTSPVNESAKPRDDMHEINLVDFDPDLDKIKIHGNFKENSEAKALNEEVHEIKIRGEELYLEEDGKSSQKKKPENEITQAISRAGRVRKEYKKPPISKLISGKNKNKGDQTRELKETAKRLQQTLLNFGVKVTMTEISQGPSVTRYEMQPEQGVKVSKIVSLQDDIKLNLAATDIRIEAPIPGKAAIGIEVPNKENTMVAFRDLVESSEFQDFPSDIAFAVGKDIGGQIIVSDIAKMPHMLIAGATGSGKSVCINTLIMSILYKAHPDDVKLIMIDPKVVELSVYNGIPHLLIPVVTDPKKAASALHWGVAEMTDRYQKFADYNVRDLKGYNKVAAGQKNDDDPDGMKPLPQVVIIVDELADLMMVAPGEVEESICRLAQLARAAGIHLIIATQRPSVDVITGLIKANMPSRIAFSVSSGVDSRTILDMIGAEKLLGKGDMLFYPQGYSKPARIQGAFITDKEVSDVVDFIKNQALGDVYDNAVEEKIKNIVPAGGLKAGASKDNGEERDSLFVDVGWFIIEADKASIGNLQRKFKIGFNRAARIMDQLCEAGVVGEEEGTKPRKILMGAEEFARYCEEYI
ncbi:MAG: DNA translocase FtsK [Lachnospiraceae bacterium]|nr:DNA translocase FtsK [Lachnospiraceae bacterium]